MERMWDGYKALVLVGGKSTRMGEAKSHIVYHGQPQYLFLKNLLEGMGLAVYVSCRKEQADDFAGNSLLFDPPGLKGPFAALKAAYDHDAQASWMVLPCDVPLLTEKSLSFLRKNHDPQFDITTFESPFDQKPEPLIAIWEGNGLKQVGQGFYQNWSLRKIISMLRSNILPPPFPEELLNVNRPEEKAELMAILEGRKMG